MEKAKCLDGKYFDFLSSHKDGVFEYRAYKCRYHSIILYGTDNGVTCPLAALSFKSPTSGKTIMAPRSDTTFADFQGLIGENNKEFRFIITNLSTLSEVKVDIMKENIAVQEVDPGAHNHALNNVNELHELQSSEIKSDQATNRKTDEKHLTVGDDEMLSTFSAGSKPKGTYFYIAVTPSTKNQILVEQFKETKWIKDDIIVIKVQVSFPQCAEKSSVRLSNPQSVITRQSYRVQQSAEIMCGEELSTQSVPRSNENYIEKCIKTAESGEITMLSYPVQQSAEFHSDEIICEDQCAVVDDKIIKESYASQVIEGDYYEQIGHKTGISYEYDVSSNVTGQLCTICLSIDPTLKFFEDSPWKEYVQRAEDLISKFLEGTQKNYLDQLKAIYKETDCVICLEKDNNIIFYDCGHACIHSSCMNASMTKCPLCRRHIYATINM